MNNETKPSRFRLGSKIASVLMSAAILATSVTGLGSVLLTQTSTEVYAAGSYGLPDNIEDGNILQCFNWKITDITAELPAIAEAGFKSVQTSPLQPHDASGPWYWLYQPLGFTVGNDLGSEEDLKNLCSEADKYGITVIVDVVANHLAGSKEGGWKDYIQSDLNSSEFFHNQGAAHNWNDRNEIIYKNIGMPDLNTEHSHVIEDVANYVKALKADGVDGIRWDAAKHIGLPSEGSNFWSTMAGLGMYNYGEILDGPSGDDKDGRESYNSQLMVEYSKYMDITDAKYFGYITGSISGGNVHEANGVWTNRGVPASKVVYWDESHDTYANDDDGGWTKNLSESVMDRAYAVFAARAEAQTMYLSRPFAKNSDSIIYGVKGSTHFTEKQVAEVNKFHNAMVGTKEYYTTAENCFVICRGGGAVVVNAGGGGKQVTVPNGGGLVPQGTYTDAVSGSTWNVTGSTMSGSIGDSGIAVFYKGGTIPGGVSISPNGGSFDTETTTVTLGAKGVSNATYTTSEGDSGSYTDGKTITIGGSTAAGSSITVTVSGTKEDGTNATATATFSKKKQGEVVKVYAKTTWSSVYAYVYTGDGESAKSMAPWPGTKMTESNGVWSLAVTGFEQGRVIFNDGTGSDTNRYPADMEPGLSIGGESMDFNSSGNTWTKHVDDDPTPQLKVTLSASPSSCKTGDAVTLTASATGATGTVSYAFKEGSNAISGSGSSATWTATTAGSHTFTVTATDSAGSATATATVTVSGGDDPTPEGPSVTVDKASGSSFETETTTITLTLKNATSGTYSVDNGPVKKFSGSQTVTIGEGKIGDSTITVAATATDGSKTANASFTYNKKYKVKTSSSSAAPTSTKYKTNPGGAVGTKKTITSASDFTADCLIAKGVANDDPGSFRGTHEAPKFDLYALYGAWDDTNLYIGIQYTNTTDINDPAQESPQTGRGKPNGADANIPQMIVLDTKTGDYTDGSTNSTEQPTVWNTNVTFGGSAKVDRVIMYSPQTGIDNWAIFPVTGGKIDYDNNIFPGYQKPLAGASLTWEDGFFLSTMDGIKGNGNDQVYKPESLDDDSKYTDFLSTSHSKEQDTFCVMTMPLQYLGVTASDIASKGIGIMAIATYGESGIGCLPHDTCMLDNAMKPYSKDDSTSGEKDDVDLITVPLAGLGKPGDGPVDPVDPVDPVTTPLQVNFGADRSAPQYNSTKLTLKGIGMGGTAPYKYEFSVDGAVVQASSSTDSVSWTPGTAKKHSIKCVITDSKGATATVTKDFTSESAGSDPGPDPDPTDPVNNSKCSASTVTVGTRVTLTGAASGGKAPYQYAYYYRKQSTSTFTTLKDFSTDTTATLTPSSAATFILRVTVKDSNGKTANKDFSLTVNPKPTPIVLTNTSSLSATTVKVKSSVTIKCSATGGTSPYLFAVYYKKSSASSYTTLKPYTSTTSATFTPETATVYNIRVSVKDNAGTVKDADFNLTVIGTPSPVNNSKISANTLTLGNSLTVTFAATSGTTPYKYALFFKKAGQSTFSQYRGYSTTKTCTFKPQSATTYTLRTKVKDNNGNVAVKDFTVKVVKKLTNTSKLSATSITLGNSVTMTGSATGGVSPYKYALFFRKYGTSSFTKYKDFSTTKTITFKPQTATTYVLRTKVKDARGVVVNKDITLKVTKKLSNTSKLSATTVTLGNSVTMTGSATGGTSPYKYALFFKKAGQTTFTKYKDFSTTKTITFKPASATTYTIRTKVKDAKGAVAYKDITLKVTKKLANTSKLSATAVTLGNSVTMTGAATGGTSPYKYALFFRKYGTTTFTKYKDFSTTKTITFKPQSATTYVLRAKVKDAKGAVANKDFTVKVTKKLANTSKLSATTVTLGNSVTMTGAATGGTSPYKYALFFRKYGTSTFTKYKDFSTTKTITFKPATATTYILRTKVKDAKGAVAYKDFTVKVNKKLANTSKLSATTVTLGNSITMTGAATGGTSPYKYALFFKKSGQTTFTKYKDFSTTKTITFKPASATTYTLRTKVKDAKGAVAYKDFTLKVTNAMTTTFKISASVVQLGKTVTVTATTTGGKSPYQTALFFKKPGATTFTQYKGYASTNSIVFKPASVGTYFLRAKAKDAAGTVRMKDFTLKVVKALVNNSTVSATSAKVGTSVTVKGVATGGTSPYQYEIAYMLSGGSSYKVVKSYSTTASASIKPTASGTYVVRVKVKDANGFVTTKYLSVKFTA